MLPRHTKLAKRPRNTRKTSQKIHQIPVQHLRRSPRNLSKPNGKKGTARENSLNPETSTFQEDLLAEQPAPQSEISSRNEDIVPRHNFETAQSSAVADITDSQIAQFRELSIEDGIQEQQNADADERPQEYVIIDYDLIMEVKGGKTDYKIECTAGGLTHRAKGTFNLAKILAPGSIAT